MRLFPFYRSRDPGLTLLDLILVFTLLVVFLVLGPSSLTAALTPGSARIYAQDPIGTSDPLLTQLFVADDIMVGKTKNPLFLFDAYARAPDALPYQALTPASRYCYLIGLQAPQTPTYEFTTEVMVTGRHYVKKSGIKNMLPSGAIHLAQSDQIGENFGGHLILNV